MRWTFVVTLVFVVAGCSQPAPPDQRVEMLVDRFAVQDTVNELFLATDEKAWDRVRAVFADTVAFDMTSLAGGEPVEMTPNAIADAWAEGLGPVTAVHHQTGNFTIEVDGDSASAGCYGTATHFRPEQDKRLTYFVGSYDFHLVRGDGGWKIDRIRFDAKYVE